MNFKVGEVVICISESFQIVETDENHVVAPDAVYGENAETHPQLWEALKIVNIFGGFLCFEKYNTPETVNTWFFNRFASVDDALAILADHIVESYPTCDFGDKSPFEVGKKVVCIKNEFTVHPMDEDFEVQKDAQGILPESKPQLWELLEIKQMRNNMLNFGEYNRPEMQIWWPQGSFGTPKMLYALLDDHLRKQAQAATNG